MDVIAISSPACTCIPRSPTPHIGPRASAHAHGPPTYPHTGAPPAPTVHGAFRRSCPAYMLDAHRPSLRVALPPRPPAGLTRSAPVPVVPFSLSRQPIPS
ncbi:hypothetical protein HYPSUDRAFT_70964 [Hypholoma sublateritium FD-334 SS-4]|uniref:Uncharacterized protein n=1 Tax=Hypholoma sublateritium (strain FD-334 SS-4) TaxID=945553 RepID=A0A0D2M1B8_HYPSF|nr:hypothetical protein HYPSUDRAFT_70964 [Hypholoma sublateritium FD-334 SS-4]